MARIVDEDASAQQGDLLLEVGLDQFEEFTARDDLFGVEKNAAEEIVEDQWTA